jgi:hypothetical protein
MKSITESLKNLFFGTKKPKITTLINYCTNDYRFIGFCIREAAVFSHEVIVPYTNYFYDGTRENEELLEQTIRENPLARFKFFEYQPQLEVLPQHWVTHARVVGWQNSSPDSDFILFLDADEIVDAARFQIWLSEFPLHKMNSIKFANYYYFRDTKYQSVTFEDSVVLARKSMLNEAMIMDFLDREFIHRSIKEPKNRMVLGRDSQPLIHHYSWVRTEEEMIKKVSSWGHSHERDWISLVKAEFSRDFQGIDFVHGYKYKTVDPFINLN